MSTKPMLDAELNRFILSEPRRFHPDMGLVSVIRDNADGSSIVRVESQVSRNNGTPDFAFSPGTHWRVTTALLASRA